MTTFRDLLKILDGDNLEPERPKSEPFKDLLLSFEKNHEDFFTLKPAPEDESLHLMVGPVRICSCCREAWPLDEEFFPLSESGEEEFETWCIACTLEGSAPRKQSVVGHIEMIFSMPGGVLKKQQDGESLNAA